MKFTLYTANCIGNPQNSLYPDKVEINGADDMKAAVAYDHVCAEFRNSHRSNTEFLSADNIPMDCDNDHSDNPSDWVTPLEVAMAFPGVEFVVVYSRNNMLMKSGKSPRPRFHVYFPTQPITDSAEYIALKKRIAAEFPYFDKNALDSARLLFGVPNPQVEIYSGDMSVVDFLDNEDFEQWDNDSALVTEGSRNCYETDTSRTIDTGGNSPDSNQGGVAVVAVQGSMIGRADKNGPQGSGVNEDISFALNTTDRHAIAFSQDSYTKYSENDKCGALRAAGGMYGGGSETLVYSTSKNSYHTEAEENLANTLVASDYKDPPTVNSPEYIVRRLTPTECARLQGFPDWWCADLGTDEPTDEELRFWKDVFETHRKIVGGAVKPKSEKQILTWLKNPHSDSSEYKLWGNGVALPCVFFVLSGIVWFSSCSN